VRFLGRRAAGGEPHHWLSRSRGPRFARELVLIAAPGAIGDSLLDPRPDDDELGRGASDTLAELGVTVASWP
jgi:hypothetical protein